MFLTLLLLSYNIPIISFVARTPIITKKPYKPTLSQTAHYPLKIISSSQSRISNKQQINCQNFTISKNLCYFLSFISTWNHSSPSWHSWSLPSHYKPTWLPKWSNILLPMEWYSLLDPWPKPQKSNSMSTSPPYPPPSLTSPPLHRQTIPQNAQSQPPQIPRLHLQILQQTTSSLSIPPLHLLQLGSRTLRTPRNRTHHQNQPCHPPPICRSSPSRLQISKNCLHVTNTKRHLQHQKRSLHSSRRSKPHDLFRKKKIPWKRKHHTLNDQRIPHALLQGWRVSHIPIRRLHVPQRKLQRCDRHIPSMQIQLLPHVIALP